MFCEFKCAVLVVLFSLVLLAINAQAMTSPGLGFLIWQAPKNHEYKVLGEYRKDGAKLDPQKIDGFNMYRDGRFIYRHNGWARSTRINEKGCYTLTTIVNGQESRHSAQRCF